MRLLKPGEYLASSNRSVRLKNGSGSAYVTVADINPTAGEELVAGLTEKGLQ